MSGVTRRDFLKTAGKIGLRAGSFVSGLRVLEDAVASSSIVLLEPGQKNLYLTIGMSDAQRRNPGDTSFQVSSYRLNHKNPYVARAVTDVFGSYDLDGGTYPLSKEEHNTFIGWITKIVGCDEEGRVTRYLNGQFSDTDPVLEIIHSNSEETPRTALNEICASSKGRIGKDNLIGSHLVIIDNTMPGSYPALVNDGGGRRVDFYRSRICHPNTRDICDKSRDIVETLILPSDHITHIFGYPLCEGRDLTLTDDEVTRDVKERVGYVVASIAQLCPDRWDSFFPFIPAFKGRRREVQERSLRDLFCAADGVEYNGELRRIEI